MEEIIERTGGSTTKQITLKINTGFWKVIKCYNIIRIQSDGDFVLIFIQNDNGFRPRTTMKSILEKLPGNFLRIHMSHIINTDFVARFENEFVTMKSGERLPISKDYRDEFAQRMGRAYNCQVSSTNTYVLQD